MISRAKSLLILIGHHETLCTDNNWKQIFDYCSKYNATLRNGKKMHQRIVFQNPS